MTAREQMGDIRARFVKGLGLYVGRGKSIPTDMLAEATGVPLGSLNSMVRGEYVPKLAEGLVIGAAIGPTFMNHLLGPLGLEVRPAEEGDPCPFRVSAEIAEALQTLLKMLSDQRLDHTEDPVWQRLALDVAAMLVSHVNARQSAKDQPNLKVVGAAE